MIVTSPRSLDAIVFLAEVRLLIDSEMLKVLYRQTDFEESGYIIDVAHTSQYYQRHNTAKPDLHGLRSKAVGRVIVVMDV